MLKPKQQALAELMVAEPSLTHLEMAKRVNINPKTLYRWQKLPEFQEYRHACCQERFKAAEGMAIEKLIENAQGGNQRAIEYILSYIGYQAATKVELDAKTDVIINITE